MAEVAESSFCAAFLYHYLTRCSTLYRERRHLLLTNYLNNPFEASGVHFLLLNKIPSLGLGASYLNFSL